MPRRLPPSPLNLVAGPAPPRSFPKHTLPSVPRPVFYPAQASAGPAPRGTTRTAPVAFGGGIQIKKHIVSRGPWDHSGSIEVNIDVDTLVPLPLPAAVA
ncbi:hypothetical protein CYLTODRAFT_81973 [Cylindrobasidium torrendii FP15055 ss-10]|uniref:Uncharacterized protein n=1 Tax=Cylindrobasidium torrendii FP15055 ss-10 TaxID=1314674 RepID=A0A0D7B3W6_9AGAR|nr:hypothetical protein CYLTODRAFT_81973 [Cylindrobasidium torrendii FP15055 ss-10]